VYISWDSCVIERNDTPLDNPLAYDKKTILFIDTGDNCRCPMAAGFFLKLLEQRGIKHIDIRTAGVMTPTGLLPTPEAVQLLQDEGVDIRRHRSRPLTREMIKRADLILGMTPFHVQSALRINEEARGKTFLLKEYVGRDGKNTQIADPMGGTLEIFKRCFSEIRASLHRLVEMEIVTKPPRPIESPRITTGQAQAEAAQGASAKAGAKRGSKPKAAAPKAKKAKPAAKAKKPAATAAKRGRKPKAQRAKPPAKPAKRGRPAKPGSRKPERKDTGAAPRKRGRPPKRKG
jgi:protein-tyrosine-phosphatase